MKMPTAIYRNHQTTCPTSPCRRHATPDPWSSTKAYPGTTFSWRCPGPTPTPSGDATSIPASTKASPSTSRKCCCRPACSASAPNPGKSSTAMPACARCAWKWTSAWPSVTSASSRRRTTWPERCRWTTKRRWKKRCSSPSTPARRFPTRWANCRSSNSWPTPGSTPCACSCSPTSCSTRSTRSPRRCTTTPPQPTR